MAEDLVQNLKNYQLQLQQVETALTTDSDSEDLTKLKRDLEEVIELTRDLIKSQTGVDVPASGESAESPQDGGGSATSGTSGAEASASTSSTVTWKVGDKCLAHYVEDATFYPAIIDEIQDDGSCTVTFEVYGNTEVTQIQLLKSYEDSDSKKRGAEDQEGGGGGKKVKTKKDLLADQREYKRKKSQKKAQRRQELEQVKEKEKDDWLAFNTKTFSKTSKGKVKKSIFASPDSTVGKVGVGTCGQAGRPMTAYHQNEKWKKSMS